MSRRPLSVTILGWLFIAVGGLALLYHITELKLQRPFNYQPALVCFVRLLAIVGGAFLLRGHNWARWLLGLWMTFHVVLSIFHSPVELGMHLLLFGVIGYFLCRPRASAYFRKTGLERLDSAEHGDTSGIPEAH